MLEVEVSAADRALLEKYRLPAEELQGEPGYLTSFIGVKTSVEVFPHLAHLSGTVIADLPIPDDKTYGGAHEYISLLRAVEQRREARELTAVELGAGWGPWIAGVGVVCRREGFRKVHLVGVEADPGRFAFMRKHLRHNLQAAGGGEDAREGAEIVCQTYSAAVWPENARVFFPLVDSSRDHGGAASGAPCAIDYRGVRLRHREVRGLTLDAICNGLATIDYMHWDIQGAELEIATTFQDFLSERVRTLFIGTHSTRQEGGLIALFHKMGWELLHYRPCLFHYDRKKPSLEGMVTVDGELSLRNPAL